MKRSHGERGNSLLEFAFCVLFLVPLMMGVWVLGMNFGRAMQTSTLCRSVGAMYVRQTDFTTTANKQILARLAGGLDLQVTNSSSGKGVVILSKVLFAGSGTCTAVAAGACSNQDQTVFLQRIRVGNTSIQPSYMSSIGNPTCTLDSTGSPPGTTYLTDPGCRATSFPVAMQDGARAFVSEAYFMEPSLNISGGPGWPSMSGAVYARNFF